MHVLRSRETLCSSMTKSELHLSISLLQCITSIMQGLSREHACIEIKGDSVFIYDKVSRNRTRRNKVGLLSFSVPQHSNLFTAAFISHAAILKMIILFFCLKIFFTCTYSVDPDEMQHYTAFHLAFLCMQKYLFRGFPNT